MKPLNKKNYGSIGHFSISKLGEGDHHINPGQERILTQKTRDKFDYIHITEKYDGSNVGIAKVDNKIYALVRKGYEAKTSPFMMHHYFNDWVVANENLFKHILNEGERIVGEWMLQVHSLSYKIPSHLPPFIALDWFNANNKRYVQADLHNCLMPYKIARPRVLYEGYAAFSIEDALNILHADFNKNKYIHCNNKNPEGLVYRVERKGKVDFLSKYVRHDFVPGIYLIKDAPPIWNMEMDEFQNNLVISG